MLRLVLWIWRVVIVGQKPRPACVRAQPSHHSGRASVSCLSGLCVPCCEARCRCLDAVVKQTRELQA